MFLEPKPWMSPNLSQLIKATVPHVGFLRMSDCQASSNPRICFAPRGKNVTMKNKSLSVVDASEPSPTLISADASIAPISHLCCSFKSAIEIHVRHKGIVFNQCAKSHSRRNTGRPVDNCDRFAQKSIRLPSISLLVIFTILFQLKVKRQTDQPLDHNNPLECKKSLKCLDKIVRGFGQRLQLLGKMLES